MYFIEPRWPGITTGWATMRPSAVKIAQDASCASFTTCE